MWIVNEGPVVAMTWGKGSSQEWITGANSLAPIYFVFFFSLIGREERGAVDLEVLNACLIGTHELKLFLPSLTMPTTLVLLFILQLYQHPISLHLFSRSRGQGNQKNSSEFTPQTSIIVFFVPPCVSSSSFK